MPRRPRMATGGLAYHVLNRGVGRLPLLENPKKTPAPFLTVTFHRAVILGRRV